MLAALPASEPKPQSDCLPTFAEAIDLHKSMVYSIAWQFLRDRSAAEELAQDIFLQLHNNWQSIQSAAHLLFWLRKTATHRAIDASRRRKALPVASLDAAPEPAVNHPLPDSLLVRQINRFIAALPEVQRSVIILRYQEDLALEEVAELLNLNRNTVKTHLSRGLHFLREKCQRVLKTSRT